MTENPEQHDETSSLRVAFPRRYRFIEKIGRQGKAELWNVRDRSLKRTVLYRRSMGDDWGNRRIKREFSIISSLHHSTLPILYDLGKEEDGSAFFTFEYLPGTDLSSFLSKFGVDCLPRVVYQICRALEYFHFRDCYFRVLTPDNPVVVPLSTGNHFRKAPPATGGDAEMCRYFRVKFTDFGQTFRRGETEIPDGQIPMESNDSIYAAPELLRDGTCHPTADLYSLGVILYSALSGELPFRDSSTAGIHRLKVESGDIYRKDYLARISGNLAPVIERLLAYSPEERFPDAVTTRRELLLAFKALDPDLDYFSERLEDGEFIAEERASAVLDRYLEDSAGGMVSLLSGKEGMGKTALSREWKTRAQLADCLVLHVSCRSGRKGTIGYVLRELMLASIFAAGEMSLSPNARELSALKLSIPELSQGYRNNLPRLRDRTAFFHALLAYLKRISARMKMLVIVDDFQFSDDLSRAFLLYAMKRTGNCPVGWLVAVDSAHASIRNLVHDRLESREDMNEIRLVPLDHERTADWLKSILQDEPFSESLPAFLLAKSGGTPLFVREYLRYFLQNSLLVRENGRWNITPDMDLLPAHEFFSRQVRENLVSLDSSTLNFLKWIILFRGNFHPELLLKTSSRYFFRIFEHLDTLVRKGLVTRHSVSTNLVYRLTLPHHFTSEFMSLESAEVTEYHRYLAEDLERLKGKNREEVVEILAHHFFLGDKPLKGLMYTLISAEKARRLFSYRDARSWYRKALELSIRLEKRDNILAILENLGDLSMLDGEPEEGEGYYRRVLREESDLLEESDRPRILRKLGETFLARTDYPRALSCFRQGLSERRCSVEESILLRLNLSRVHENQGDCEKAITLVREALSIDEACDYPLLLARAMNGLGNLYFTSGNLQEALWYYRASLEYRALMNDIAGQGLLHNNIGIVLLKKGNVDDAIEQFQKSLEIRRRIGEATAIASSLENLGIALWQRSEDDRALECFHRSIALRREVENRVGMAGTYSRLGSIFLKRGKYIQALENYHKCLDIQSGIHDRKGMARTHESLGFLYGTLNDPDRSLEEYEKCMLFLKDVADGKEKANLFLRSGSALFRMGKIKEAREHLEKFLSAGRDSNVRECIADSLEMLGRCSLLEGTVERGISLLEESLRINRSLGDDVRIASSLSLLGHAMIGAGRIDQGLEHLFHALKFYETGGYGDDGALAQARGVLHRRIAQSLLEKGNREKAVDYYQKASEILEGCASDDEMGILYRVGAAINFAAGDRESGMDNLRRSVDLLRRSGFIHELVTSLFELGLRRMRSGDPSGGMRTFLQVQHILQDTSMEKRRKLVDEIVKILREYEILPVKKSISASYPVIRRLADLAESEGDLDEVLEKSLDIVLETISGDRGIILLYDEDSREPVPAVHRNLDADTIEHIRNFSRIILEKFPVEQGPFYSLNVRKDKTVLPYKSIEEKRVSSFVYLPLKSGDELFGVLYVDHLNFPGLFTGKEVDFLQDLVNLINRMIGAVPGGKFLESGEEASGWKPQRTEGFAGSAGEVVETSSSIHGRLDSSIVGGVDEGRDDGEVEELNLDELERISIEKALALSDWVQTRAAELLGVSERTLRYKMKKHQITNPKRK